jgi:hypothetical protein
LVREQVRQLRAIDARQKRLEKLLGTAYRVLPQVHHRATLAGIGEVTAAVLTAIILTIDRFETPGKRVAYFGVLPVEVASGVERDGQARPPRRRVMSRRGHDLVRRYLGRAALSAMRCNPAVRALYARVVAHHPQEKAIAVGHAMRKLLPLVFASWRRGQPFNPEHSPWQAPAHLEASDSDTAREDNSAGTPRSKSDPAAGHQPDLLPAASVVTAAGTDKVAAAEPVVANRYLDFAQLKRQLPLARVLDQRGLWSRLGGSGPQRRGACPRHRGDARGRTFSVNLDENVFPCFAKRCGQKGDSIDLWAAVHGRSLREAARDLVQTFGREPAPPSGTEKRHG